MRVVLAIVGLCAITLVIIDCRHAEIGDPRRLSRRAALIAFIIAFLSIFAASAHARPSPYPQDQFDGDKYRARQAQMGADVANAVKRQRAGKARYSHPTRKRPPVSRKRWRDVPIPAPRPLANVDYREPSADPVAEPPLSVAGGAWREAKRAVGRPRAWCGWWLGKHLGMPLRHLWLARNWAKVGSPAGGPRIGAIVVWRHHVGIITGRTASGWVVKSGNDGGRVRERPRSIAGAIAFRSSS